MGSISTKKRKLGPPPRPPQTHMRTLDYGISLHPSKKYHNKVLTPMKLQKIVCTVHPLKAREPPLDVFYTFPNKVSLSQK